MTQAHWDMVVKGIATNAPPSHLGATDLAMEALIKRAGVEPKDICKMYHPASSEDMTRFSFTSLRKRMSTVTINNKTDDFDRQLQIKGGWDVVLDCCSHYIDQNG